MIPLITLSVFDGISCGAVALDRAGIQVETYYASEIEENAIAISKQNHANIVQLGDVTRWREWDIPWDRIDLLIGGSPCQGFSRAGKGLNFKDPRSRLFFVFVEILNHIRTVNPDVKFLLENVKMKTEWRDVITEHLGVEPIEINSKLFSAQNRLRTYWTNIPISRPLEDKGVVLLDVLETDIDTAGFIEHDGILFSPTISEASRNLVRVVDGEVRISQDVKQGYIVAENGDGVNISFPTSKSRRGRVIKQKSSTVDCVCNICVLQDGVIRRLTVRELERLQTLPEGYTDGFSPGIAQKAIGNGWTVDVLTHIFSGLAEEPVEEVHTTNRAVDLEKEQMREMLLDMAKVFNEMSQHILEVCR